MQILSDAELEALGLYRISPSWTVWLLNVFAIPILLLLAGLVLYRYGPGSDTLRLAFLAPAPLALLMHLSYALWTRADRNSHHADILYLRNYSKHAPRKAFFHGTSKLQLTVKGLLRPPYDIVSLFPPPRTQEELIQDSIRTRGISHAFAFRTKDDRTWKEAIEYFMGRCRLVVVECYRLEGGFAWEVHKLVETVTWDRIVLVSKIADLDHATELKRLLEKRYRSTSPDQEVDIPLIVFGGPHFRSSSSSLLETVRRLAPYTQQFMNERLGSVALAISLRVANFVCTVLFWIGMLVAVLALIYATARRLY